MKNTMSDTIDIESEQENQSLVPFTKNQLPAVVEKIATPLTSQQAKIDAVANLTFKAYERASTLVLTEAESVALRADFEDDAFRLGAGGDANLIYIEHAQLRERLNKVFGLGQWSIIPRNRWSEDYKTGDGKPACRVYVEAMLLARGCFVAEAVGDMTYYPQNAKTNYGDAVEGAKSACLRRCAKELGIGLQAWKKSFCEEWKARQKSPKGKPAQKVEEPDGVPMDFPPKVEKKSEPSKPSSVSDRRKKMLAKFAEVSLDVAMVRDWAIKASILLPNEFVEAWPAHQLPSSKDEMDAILKRIGEFGAGGEAIKADFMKKNTIEGEITP